MATTETVAMEEASHGHLRRELRFWEAIAISIGIMAPTSTSSAPLSKQYVGSGMEDTINFGVTLSAFASCLGCAAGASRILFALGRDGFLTRRLGDASSRTGSPANSLGVVMIFGLVVILLRLNGTTAVNAFFYPGTAGVLAMLIAYFVMQFGAAKFLHLERREPRWRVVILVLATAAIVYTFFKQVWPKPAYPYDLFPLIIAGWAVLGAAITFAFPALTPANRPRSLGVRGNRRRTDMRRTR